MTWVRLDDHVDEHPKIAAVGPLGLALWTAGLTYCNRALTDGFIPERVARKLVDWTWTSPSGVVWQIGISGTSENGASPGYDVDSEMVIEQLVEHGLFEPVDGGYQIHDYLDYQPSREEVLASREQATERQRRWRASRRDQQRDQQRDSQRDQRRESHGESQRSHTDPVPVVKEREKKRERNAVSHSVTAPEPMTSERVANACRLWLSSPAFDVETMNAEHAAEEFERIERRLRCSLSPLDRNELLALATSASRAFVGEEP